jgi:hypothetical protein
MKKQLRKRLLNISCILVVAVLEFFPLLLTAQSKRISGVVTTGSNEPLPGATVEVKQTKKAVATDTQGQFTI